MAGCSNKSTNEKATAAKRTCGTKTCRRSQSGGADDNDHLAKGTAISAAARQTLATDKNKVGDTFAASLNRADPGRWKDGDSQGHSSNLPNRQGKRTN